MSDGFLEWARELHESCLVADAHYDMLNIVERKRRAGRHNVVATDYLDKLQRGGVNLLICSLFVDDCYIPEMALRNALDQIAALHQEIDESGGAIRLCRNVTEIRAAASAGKIAVLLSFEGVEPLGNDMALLRVFYELGVRGVGLAWSRRNYAADGCAFTPVLEGTRGGLTAWGVKLVSEIERLQMYLDVSHLNDEGFWDIVRLTKRPFLASHSNCRALTPVMRNLDDAQIKALADRGGVMGMNCCRSFVRLRQGGRATPAEMATHGDHVRTLVGADHLSFGFDFCDEERRMEGAPENDSFPYYDSAPELTEHLLERGFSESEVRGVLGENLLRFLEKTIA